jgi:hypothetical protein
MIDFSLSNKLTDDVIVSNDLVYVLQQIDLLFETNKGDVLGDMSFGSHYDDYVYSLDHGNGDLEEIITADLKDLDLCGYEPYVVVKLLEGSIRDIALIDITLVDGSSSFNKSYVIK